ncbi:MAG: hypothetical protein ACRBN8_40030 [Nannocystales bacterium]
MQTRRLGSTTKAIALLAIVLLAACAAGDPKYSLDAPAGFWAGLWHGIISLVALVVGFFFDSVEIYERDNVGTWYDVGFMLGILCISGGGGSEAHRRARRRRNDEEWQEVAGKVEAKVRRKLRAWAEAEPDEDWDEVEQKVGEKLKRKLRTWAEEP